MRGMKQIELATLSGISKYSISHYLKGDWEGKHGSWGMMSRLRERRWQKVLLQSLPALSRCPR